MDDQFSLRFKNKTLTKSKFTRSVSPLKSQKVILGVPHHLQQLHQLRKERSAQIIQPLYKNVFSSSILLDVPVDQLLKQAIKDSHKYLQMPDDYPVQEHNQGMTTRELTLILLKQHSWLVQRLGPLLQHSEQAKLNLLQLKVERGNQQTQEYMMQINELTQRLKEKPEQEIKLRQMNSVLLEKLQQVETQVKDLLMEQNKDNFKSQSTIFQNEPLTSIGSQSAQNFNSNLQSKFNQTFDHRQSQSHKRRRPAKDSFGSAPLSSGRINTDQVDQQKYQDLYANQVASCQLIEQILQEWSLDMEQIQLAKERIQLFDGTFQELQQLKTLNKEITYRSRQLNSDNKRLKRQFTEILTQFQMYISDQEQQMARQIKKWQVKLQKQNNQNFQRQNLYSCYSSPNLQIGNNEPITTRKNSTTYSKQSTESFQSDQKNGIRGKSENSILLDRRYLQKSKNKRAEQLSFNPTKIESNQSSESVTLQLFSSRPTLIQNSVDASTSRSVQGDLTRAVETVNELIKKLGISSNEKNQIQSDNCTVLVAKLNLIKQWVFQIDKMVFIDKEQLRQKEELLSKLKIFSKHQLKNQEVLSKVLKKHKCESVEQIEIKIEKLERSKRHNKQFQDFIVIEINKLNQLFLTKCNGKQNKELIQLLSDFTQKIQPVLEMDLTDNTDRFSEQITPKAQHQIKQFQTHDNTQRLYLSQCPDKTELTQKIITKKRSALHLNTRNAI